MGTWPRAKLSPGIYDDILSARLDAELRALGPSFDVVRHVLGKTEVVASSLGTLHQNGNRPRSLRA